ncbi:MlaD family protein [Nocardia cyriacigeorgica]|uniref:Virulence factor Mce family protein n=1 Tax=Nocardia cyriacigeorgica TaxID=135487 RepID=A0A4V6YTA8_9NOCA|nr:MlaD family protein [Nocardia cyriacigeorgica]VFA96373.1 virulence factor Mce family protein [Nocardia cyriacigeorgica]
MNKLLASRGLMSVLGVAVVCAILIVGYFVIIEPPKRMRSYCANMPDAIGLYAGNHVTMRGVRVGSVTRIEPHGDMVRVEFEVEVNHSPRGQVSATTVSDTIVADRSLALLDDSEAEHEWDSGQCITRTLTPKSMSQTMNALGNLAAEITDGNGSTQRERLADELAALDAALSGTGPEMNDTILKLGRALNSPNAAIGHIGALIDSLRSLSDSMAGGWGDIKAMITRLAPGLEVIDRGIFERTVSIIDSLRIIVPWLNEITSMFGDQILEALNATVPLARLARANIGSVQEIIDLTPPLVQAFQRATAQEGGSPILTYAAPVAQLPPADAERVCAAIERVVPGSCKSAENELEKVSVLPLIFGTAGAR